MKAAAVAIDERLSWARREGSMVRVHLRLQGTSLEPGAASMQLVSAQGRFLVPAVVAVAEATTVEVSVPQSELGRSTWGLAVQPATSTGFVPLEARLVAAPTSPVALLPGPAPATRMRPPIPTARRSAPFRLAARLPAPVRHALRRARSWVRGPSGRLR